MRGFGLLIMAILFSEILSAKTLQNVPVVAKESLFDLINEEDFKEVNLEFDLDSLLRDRRNTNSFKGILTFEDHNGQLQSWKTKVKIRGKFRRFRCTEMPPLKLSFKKKSLMEAGLALHNDFKLVTQCIEDEKEARALLLKEFLAYKMYNELTDMSFRVQFLKINFKDIHSGRTESQWGFIIEDTAELRARLTAEKCSQKFGLNPAQFNEQQFKTMALFQYMIGNLDWDAYKKVHNVKVIDKDGILFAIPYDFDFSALVFAPYATLNPNYQQESLLDRMYLGHPDQLEDMAAVKQLFETKKTNIIQLVKNTKELNRDDRRTMLNYLHSFYKNIDDIQLPKLVNQEKQVSATH